MKRTHSDEISLPLVPELWCKIIYCACQPFPLTFLLISHQWSKLTEQSCQPLLIHWMEEMRKKEFYGTFYVPNYTRYDTVRMIGKIREHPRPDDLLALWYAELWPERLPPLKLYLCHKRMAFLRKKISLPLVYEKSMRTIYLIRLIENRYVIYSLDQYSLILDKEPRWKNPVFWPQILTSLHHIVWSCYGPVSMATESLGPDTEIGQHHFVQTSKTVVQLCEMLQMMINDAYYLVQHTSYCLCQEWHNKWLDG